jgi:hypothetical protein
LGFIVSRPVSGNLCWWDIEAVFVELEAGVSERAGVRVPIVLSVEVSQGLCQPTSIH